MNRLLIKRLSEAAVKPTRQSLGSAGYDLYAAADVMIEGRGYRLIPTDIAVVIPEGHYGRISSRSGLALRYGLEVGAGVIDEDYRGSLGVILHNHSNTDYQVRRGDRIAQLIIEPYKVVEVVEVEDLGTTERGTGGFGSTGK